MSENATSYKRPTAPYQHGPRTFTPEEMAIAAAAIDTGAHAAAQVPEAVVDWHELHPATLTCITGTEQAPWVDRPEGFPALAKFMDSLHLQLRALPRGAYALIRETETESDRPGWTLVMHDGKGTLFSPGFGFGGTHERPDPHAALAEMELSELSACMDAEQWRLRGIVARRLIQKRSWVVGTELRDLEIEGERFRCGMIERIDVHGLVSVVVNDRVSQKLRRFTALPQKIRYNPSLGLSGS